MTTVALAGALDTKGEEYRFARGRLRDLGAEPVVIDTGVLGGPAFAPDISADEVAAAAGTTLAALREAGDRAGALAAMGRGLAGLLSQLRAEGRIDGVLALGGSGGTTVAASAFRSLPIGFPKLIVSTMTSGNVRGFVGDSDLILAASVVDIAGLNRISRLVIGNAAAAIAGMAAAAQVTTGPVTGGQDRPLVVASMIGLTSRAVTAARQRLEELGYEVIVFHSTGAGGAAMESLIDSGLVAGVLDLTTSELADELGGGVCDAGPGRLRTAARRGIPQVVAPGGLDMINFGRPETVPARYAARVQHHHNSEITLVRTDAAESAELGRRLAERVAGPAADAGAAAGDAAGGDAAAGPEPAILLPDGGLSAIDSDGHPFRDAGADAALIGAVRAAARPGRVRLVEVPGNIDRAETGDLAARLLHELITSAREPLCTP